MKKIDIFSKRNFATETFNEVSKIIETSDFKNQIGDFVKSMKIREVFLMKSEVIGVDSIELANKEKVFSENTWFNLVDFLKTQLNLYENSENKKLVQDYITDTIDSHCYSIFGDNDISSKSKNVDDLNYFLTDLNGVTFSYDIDKKTILMFVSDTGEYTTTDNKYFYQFGYYVNNKIQINTNLLKIFSFDYFGNFRDLYKDLENEFNLKFLKYAVGLEDESWLSSFIVSEIRNNFENIISSWIEESLKFNSKVFHLELFPYNFYKDGTLVLEPNFESEYEITDYISRKSYNDDFVNVDELISYYKTLLTAIINKKYDSILPSDENDDDCYWTNMEYPVSQWAEIVKTSKLTDSDIDRLRAELSPLIDKVFESLILSDIAAVSNYYVRRSARDGLYYKFSLNILSDLLHHIGYSPSKLNIGKIIFRERKLLNTIEELSSVKYLKELEGFDFNISIILTEDVTEYYADKIPQLEKLVKDKLGDDAKLVTFNSPEYDIERKAIDVTDLYPEYRIQRI
jgi:hypothetical protein